MDVGVDIQDIDTRRYTFLHISKGCRHRYVCVYLSPGSPLALAPPGPGAAGRSSDCPAGVHTAPALRPPWAAPTSLCRRPRPTPRPATGPYGDSAMRRESPAPLRFPLWCAGRGTGSPGLPPGGGGAGHREQSGCSGTLGGAGVNGGTLPTPGGNSNPGPGFNR